MSSADRQRLSTFTQQSLPPTFRYYQKRNVETAIQTHIYTLLYCVNGEDVAYAHIDYDAQTNRNYLGLCVLSDFQGQGIGMALLQFLLKLHTGDLYLTVDKTNEYAIALYKKFQFEICETMEHCFRMKRTAILTLPVSTGEAIDKLSILDIKIQNIQNQKKREDCEKEKAAIVPFLEQSLQRTPHLYKWLLYVNQKIWDLQDDVRALKNNNADTLKQILDLNDMRFRIKKRVNSTFDSSLQEQKGYAEKVAIFMGNIGTGDMINLNSAVRYMALQYDKLHVLCKDRNIAMARQMYKDDSSIEIVEYVDTPAGREMINKYEKQGIDVIRSGNFINRIEFDHLPEAFYDDMNVPRDVLLSFFHIVFPDQLPVPTRPYVFCHANSSNFSNLQFPVLQSKDEIFVIDPNSNHYRVGHVWYNDAQKYVDQPILAYKDVIENASQIHVSDSSFYCLTCFLSCSAKVRVCYERFTLQPLENYNFTFYMTPSKPKPTQKPLAQRNTTLVAGRFRLKH